VSHLTCGIEFCNTNKVMVLFLQKKYNIVKLIYFEEYQNIMDAIDRETQLKKWNRKWKDELIDTINKERIDLAKDWYSDKDIIDYFEIKKISFK
jgi:hypothetical protein